MLIPTCQDLWTNYQLPVTSDKSKRGRCKWRVHHDMAVTQPSRRSHKSDAPCHRARHCRVGFGRFQQQASLLFRDESASASSVKCRKPSCFEALTSSTTDE